MLETLIEGRLSHIGDRVFSRTEMALWTDADPNEVDVVLIEMVRQDRLRLVGPARFHAPRAD